MPQKDKLLTLSRKTDCMKKKPAVDVGELKDRFAAYLRKQKYRNTQERYLVLESAISMEEHFSADELYLHMRSAKLKVSRATVYSTLDLLTKCNILMKHRFQEGGAHFELADKMPNHDHLICTECGRILEFQEEALDAITNKVCEEFGFKAIKHSLQIFAVCKDTRTCEYNTP